MKRSFGIFFAALSIAAISMAQSAIQLDGIAAEVGGAQITIADVMTDAREMAYASGRTDVISNPNALKGLYSSSLSNLVNRQLVLCHYEQGQAKIPDWYFNQRIERIIDGSFDGDRSKMVAALESRGISFAQWRKRRIDDMIYSTMRQQFVDMNIKVRPSDIDRVYREKYADTKLSGHVKVSMIMLNGGDDLEAAKKTASELVEKLRGGDDFAAAARQYSRETHAKDGGSWGYIEPQDDLRKELADAIAKLGIGAVSDPVVLGEYIYILRKDDERSDLTVPKELVRDEIEEAIFREMSDKRFVEWLEFLATKYTVRIFVK